MISESRERVTMIRSSMLIIRTDVLVGVETY
jgi:hypothetical protein